MMIPLDLARKAICPFCAAGDMPQGMCKCGSTNLVFQTFYAGEEYLPLYQCPDCHENEVVKGKFGTHRIPDQQMRGHFEEPECPAWPIIVAAKGTL